jgi:type I restriction enzyme S subunit
MTAKTPPDGWQFSAFGDLCSHKGEYGANVSKAPFDERLPRYVRITDIAENGLLRESDPASISEEAARGYFLEPGDVVLARSGATVGKSYVHEARNGRCAYAGYLIRFRTRRETLVPEYVKQFFRSETYWNWIRETQRAQAQPNINAAEYASLSMPLPPLGEQRKIAAILSSVDDAIEATQAVIDQLQVVKKAMMAELLTRGLPGRHTRFKQTEIGEVPEEWDVVSLDSCVEADRPICYGILMPGTGHQGGVPVVKVKNIKNGVIDMSDLLLTSPDLDRQYARSRLRSGDVLLTIRGTTGRLARAEPVNENETAVVRV